MKKTADAHWEYIEALTRATLATPGTSEVGMSVDELIALIGFHYKSAFTHGWKHALEALRATEVPCTLETTVSSCRCPEAASCAPSAAVSAVSGFARRACDADNSGEEEISHVLTFLREDR